MKNQMTHLDLMHGHDFSGQRVGGWLAQEKLDGLRCLAVVFALSCLVVYCSAGDNSDFPLQELRAKGEPHGQVYTLYRNSVTNPSMRIHVATFDAQEAAVYNLGNAEQARSLFQAQPGVVVKFWWEKGRYSKVLKEQKG